MRQPHETGVADVEAFLSMLANEHKASAPTHNRALSAVLTKDEVAGLLAQLDGVMARLLSGTGMRLMEGMRFQMLAVRAQWEADWQMHRGGVEVPHTLESKYPKVGYRWGGFGFSPDPRSPLIRAAA